MNGETNLRIIPEFFSKEQMKMLYYHALAPIFPDNNQKAEIVQEIVGPEFSRIGIGTNRVAFHRNGIVFIIALDRRGFIDSFQEFKRSAEIPQYAPKGYETNMLILAEEYVNIMDEQEFRMNEAGIKEVLSRLAEAYIFEDIGYSMKNYENWGYRENGDIVCIDLGYLYPLRGQEHILSCPHCRASLRYNADYTGFVCQNPGCKKRFTTESILRKRDTTQMDIENVTILELNKVKAPKLEGFTKSFYQKWAGVFI